MSEATTETQRNRQALRGEVLSLGILTVVVVGGWFGVITALGTSTPFFVVSSNSMIPTLKVGDIIVVKGGETFSSLQVGEIIVFKQPLNPDRVIVHRIARITQDEGQVGLVTKGDNNPSQDGWVVRQQQYLGKVIFQVPYIGHIALLLSPPINYALMIIIVSVIVAIQFRPKQAQKEN